MGDIYEQAFLTISATSAPNCHTGLLEPCISECFGLEGTTLAGKSYAYAVSPGSYDDLHSHPRMGLSFEREHWPILSRAWVFQERILSRRVLHFTRRELIFECDEETVCECGFVNQDDMHDKKVYQVAVREKSPTRLAMFWYYFIEWYSSLSLSVETDRLAALSGFAQRYARLQPGCRYFAGLWDTSLSTSLLWWAYEYDYDPIVLDLPRQYVAPSWSWAAINRRVSFAASLDPNSDTTFSTVGQYFQIESADCQSATDDKTGPVTGGQLKVRGRLFDVVAHNDPQQLVLQPSCVVIPFSDGRQVLGHKPALLPDSKVWWASEEVENSRLVCLPLARTRWTYAIGEHSELELTMVLSSPRSDIDNEKYRRVGIIQQASREKYDTQTLDEIRQHWAENPSPFETGGTEATITIV
ncbi:hypothetical protein OQA88_9181 [Cercophora sp. LCS_1]